MSPGHLLKIIHADLLDTLYAPKCRASDMAISPAATKKLSAALRGCYCAAAPGPAIDKPIHCTDFVEFTECD